MCVCVGGVREFQHEIQVNINRIRYLGPLPTTTDTSLQIPIYSNYMPIAVGEEALLWVKCDYRKEILVYQRISHSTEMHNCHLLCYLP